MIKDFLCLCFSSTPTSNRTSRREEPFNILSAALNERSKERVKEAVELICSPIIPFRSAAWLMKTYYKQLLKDYPEVVMSILSQESLFFETCQPRIYDDFLLSSASREDRLRPGTSDSVLNWEDVDIRHLFEKHRERTVHDTDTPTVQTSVKFLRIEDAARIGMDGIIRPLLMQNTPMDVFHSKAIKAVIQYKWLTFWRIKCCADVVSYAIFLGVFTLYSVVVAKFSSILKGDSTDEFLKLYCPIVMAIFGLIMFCEQLIRLCTFMKDGKEYFGSRMKGVTYFFKSASNWLDLVSCMFLLLCIPTLHILASCTSDSRTASSNKSQESYGTAMEQALSATLAVEAILVYTKVISTLPDPQ